MNWIVFSLFNLSVKPNIEPDIDATTACDAEVPPACNAEVPPAYDAEATQIKVVVDDFNLSTLDISTQESMKKCCEQLIKSPNPNTIAGTYT